MDWVFYFWLFITCLGDEYFYLVALTFLYLAINKKLCYRTALILFFSMWLNDLLKNVFKLERPPGGLIEASGYGFPSGHAQNSSTFWGYLAITTQNFLIIILAVVLVAFIAYSRIYLNVHYPVDVIGGILIGISLVLIYHFLSKIFEKRVEKISFIVKILISSIVPLVLFGFFLLLFSTEVSGNIAKICGAYLGVAVGYLIEGKIVGIRDPIELKNKALRGILGIILVFVIYLSLSLLLPNGLYVRFLRYALTALAMTIFAPFLIKTLKL